MCRSVSQSLSDPQATTACNGLVQYWYFVRFTGWLSGSLKCQSQKAVLLKHRLVSQHKPFLWFDELCLLIRAEQYAKQLYSGYYCARSYFRTFNRPTHPLGFSVQHVMVTVWYTSVWRCNTSRGCCDGDNRWTQMKEPESLCLTEIRDGLFVGLRPRQLGFSKWWLFLRE